MGGLKGGRGGLRNGWAKGRGEGMGARGEYRFMKLMKLTKKKGNFMMSFTSPDFFLFMIFLHAIFL